MANVKINVDVDAQGAMKGFDLTVQGLEKTNQKAKETQTGLSGMAKTLKGECTDAISGMTGQLGSLGSVMGSAGPLGLALAASTALTVGLAKGMWDGLNAAAAYAGGINDVSVRTGRSVQFVQQYGKAWELAGVSMDGLSKAANTMDLRLATAPSKFEALGLSVDGLLSMNPDERFKAVAEQIGGMTDRTQQSSAAAAVFGGAWKDVLQGINDGALETAASMATLTDDQVAALDQFGDATTMFGQAWTTLKSGIFADLAAASELPLLVENTARALNRLAGVLTSNESAWATLFRLSVAIAPSVQNVSWLSKAMDLFGGPKLEKPKTNSALDYSAPVDRTRDALTDPRLQLQLDKDLKALTEAVAKDKAATKDAPARLKAEQERNLRNQFEFMGPTEEELTTNVTIPLRDAAKEFSIGMLESAGMLRKEAAIRAGTIGYLKNGTWYDTRFPAMGVSGISPGEEAQLNAKTGSTKPTKPPREWDKTLQNVVNGLEFVSQIAGEGAIGMWAGALASGVMGFQNIKAAGGKNASKTALATQALAVGMQAYEVGDWKSGAASGAMAGAATGNPYAIVGGAIIGGVAGYFGGEEDKKKAMANMKDKLGEQYGSLDKARLAAERYGVSLTALDQKDPKKLQAQLVELGKAMQKDQDYIEGTKLATQGFLDLTAKGFDWSGMGDIGARSFGRAFWGYIKENGSAAAAEAFGPALDKIKEQFGGVLPESYKAIERQLGYGKNEAFAAAEGQGSAAAQMLTGWQQQGYTDATSVADASAIAKKTIESSTAALVAMGLDPAEARAEALKSQAGLLKEVAATSRAGNTVLDADMRALLDEAKANGIQFLQTPMERQVDLLTQIATNTGGLGDLAPTGGSTEPAPPPSEGEPGMATGGITRTGPDGRSYRLHDREVVIPLDRLPQVVGSFGGSTGAPPVQITQNLGDVTIAVDPMATAETRADLVRLVEDHFAKQVRNQNGELAHQIESVARRVMKGG